MTINKPKTIILTAVVAVAALVAAACGSDTEEVALDEALTAGVSEQCLELAGRWNDVVYPALDAAVADAGDVDLTDRFEMDAVVTEVLVVDEETSAFFSEIGAECSDDTGSADTFLTSDYFTGVLAQAAAERSGAEAAAASYLNVLFYCEFDGEPVYDTGAAKSLCETATADVEQFGIDLSPFVSDFDDSEFEDVTGQD